MQSIANQHYAHVEATLGKTAPRVATRPVHLPLGGWARPSQVVSNDFDNTCFARRDQKTVAIAVDNKILLFTAKQQVFHASQILENLTCTRRPAHFGRGKDLTSPEQLINMRITDDGTLNGFPGRESIELPARIHSKPGKHA